MFRNRLYYRIKPLLPATMRMSVRRWFALRKREKVLDTWPILPSSEKPPKDWRGWPDGKQFAFVLTHDVEGPSGLGKCRQLMELEMKLGFRSSFNFIPEGDYIVSRDLIGELKSNGFEVGVHDLHHDGNLYRSRHGFAKKAARINHYLKDWGATGFRSGFMLHNLEWLHDLDVAYDASTFDTDPFEPQPDGVGTIFPFWVERPSVECRVSSDEDGSETTNHESRITNRQSRPGASSVNQLSTQISINPPRIGYVELPYTLPQDSTLFLLFGERHPDIWFQKLDWIARQGGMALLDAHPDFMQMDGDPPTGTEYPIELYARFLEYARQRYGKSLWHPLPKEMAAFTARLKLSPPRKPRRVCMVTHSFYLADARVTRYAEALAERGDHVDVVALRRSPELPGQETVRGVNLIRIQPRFSKQEKSSVSYLLPLLRFLFSSSQWITRSHRRERYDLVHIHNVPDFLVFAAWYPKLTGAKLILDIHDIVPEFYASKFGARDSSTTVTALKKIERASARFAHKVIIANHLWLEKYAQRTGANGKCSVFINNVDRQIFRQRPRTRTDGKFIILFPGGLQWHQGLDIAIRAFQKVIANLKAGAECRVSSDLGQNSEFKVQSSEFDVQRSTVSPSSPLASLSLGTRHSTRPPELEFHIYGDGNKKDSLIALSKELGLEDKVRFFDPLPVRQVAEIMANADLGVVPKRADGFGNEAYSTKIMEFMSLGIPVVASSTKIDRYYFNDSVLRFFESGNPDALAEAMLEVIRDPSLRQRLVTNGFEYAARNSWESRKADYLDLVDSLISDS